MKEKREQERVYVNEIDGDLVYTSEVTEKEYVDKYSGYEILEESTDDSGMITRVIRKAGQ